MIHNHEGPRLVRRKIVSVAIATVQPGSRQPPILSIGDPIRDQEKKEEVRKKLLDLGDEKQQKGSPVDSGEARTSQTNGLWLRSGVAIWTGATGSRPKKPTK
nr:unnamed protein product [Haemonchus contortus]